MSDHPRSRTVRPKKSLGQNFLSDPNTARKIVAALQATTADHVVEIGPGTGALTGFLLQAYPTFTAIEIDQRAVAYLQDQWPLLDVRQADVLAVDWEALTAEKGGPVHVIGNLPYYITSQILFGLLEARRQVHEVVVMMQLEVAQRLVALPRTKSYGILSVVLQQYAEVELLFRVSRNVFYPRPNVTSAVVRLTFKPEETSGTVDEKLFRQMVRAAFNQRRKTLRNSLRTWTEAHGVSLPKAVASRRAEELSVKDFVDLTSYLGADM